MGAVVTDTTPTLSHASNDNYLGLQNSDVTSSVDFVSIASAVPTHHQSNATKSMFSPQVSPVVDLDTSTGTSASSNADVAPLNHVVLPRTPAKGNTDKSRCSCLECVFRAQPSINGGYRACPIEGCYEHIYDTFPLVCHIVYKHSKQGDRLHCQEPRCTRTCKRGADLLRHMRLHCLRQTRYHCDVFGCKYGGENGFVRRDKLLSHKRNVHEGQATPEQLLRRRPLCPKAQREDTTIANGECEEEVGSSIQAT